jgi:hypothetical protein
MKNTLLLISASIVLFLFVFENSMAQGKWYANSAIQMVGTDYQDGSNHSSFYFYNGLRYQTPIISLGLNVPIIFGSNQLNNAEDVNAISNSSDHMGGGLSSLEVDLGDVYLYGSYQIVNESSIIPAITLDGYIKLPTSTSNLNFNTDSMDEQIAVGLSKVIEHISFFVQFGYLFIGNNNDSNFKDPWTISVGIGYSFDRGRHSILVAYDSYTNIIEGVQSISQMALGYNFLIRKGLFFTTILSSGLNNSTAGYTISGGLNFEL